VKKPFFKKAWVLGNPDFNLNKFPQGRDLSIAYFLVTMTYILIGIIFYVTFPLAKSCIEDVSRQIKNTLLLSFTSLCLFQNILNNFPGWDPLAVAARIFLLFQLVTVFPLVAYMIRVQFFAALKLPATSLQARGPILALNIFILGICVIFAIFLPKIGTIARYTLH